MREFLSVLRLTAGIQGVRSGTVSLKRLEGHYAPSSNVRLQTAGQTKKWIPKTEQPRVKEIDFFTNVLRSTLPIYMEEPQKNTTTSLLVVCVCERSKT